MSVLIKGMKKPETCSKCPFCQFGGVPILERRCLVIGESIFFDAKENRAGNCPLVEIPPHGKLINKDALMEYIEETYCTPCPHDGDYNYCKACRIDDALDAVEDAPTIIESEEENE